MKRRTQGTHLREFRALSADQSALRFPGNSLPFELTKLTEGSLHSVTRSRLCLRHLAEAEYGTDQHPPALLAVVALWLAGGILAAVMVGFVLFILWWSVVGIRRLLR
jgi:hypothetical protein